MKYEIIPVRDHVEVYDEHGKFIFSEDTYHKAQEEIKKLLNNKQLIKRKVVW